MNSFTSGFESNAKKKMDKVLRIDHISEEMFQNLIMRPNETLEFCRQVCEDWKFWIDETKLLPIKYMLDFGDKKHEDEDDDLVPESVYTDDIKFGTVKENIPGWCGAVKKFAKISSLEDLEEVKESLKIVKQDIGIWRFLGGPFHLAAEFGHLKLMQFLLYTDYDVNWKGQYWTDGEGVVRDLGDDHNNLDHNTAFMYACEYGQSEIVQFMINFSKQYGIDINEFNDERSDATGFSLACEKGHAEVVKVILESSKQCGIDICAADINLERSGGGWNGFDAAWYNGHMEVVKLIFENHEKYDIPLQKCSFYKFPTVERHVPKENKAEMKKMIAIIEAHKKKHQRMDETDADRSKKAKYEVIVID